MCSFCLLLSLITSFMHLSVHRFIYCVDLISILSWLPILTIHYEQVHRNKVGHRHTHTHTYLFASSLSTCHIPCDLMTYFFRYLCLLFHLREIITLYYNNALGKKERRKKKKKKSSNHAKSVLPVKWLLWAHFHWPGLSAIRKKSLGKLKGQRTIP